VVTSVHYRLIDFKRRKVDVPARRRADRIRSEPHRLHRADQVRDGEQAYILAPQRLAVGDKIVAGESVDVKPGNAMPLARCRSARSSTTSS
jgi:large subunit ribosomal protein L2